MEWLLTCTFFGILYVKIIFYRRILFSLEKKRKRRGKASPSPAFYNQRKRIYSPLPQPPPAPSHVSASGTPIPSFPPASGAPWGHMGTPNNTTAPAPKWRRHPSHRRGCLLQLHPPATLKEETLARGCAMELSVTVLWLCLGTASAPGASPLVLPRAGESPTF